MRSFATGTGRGQGGRTRGLEELAADVLGLRDARHLNDDALVHGPAASLTTVTVLIRAHDEKGAFS